MRFERKPILAFRIGKYRHSANHLQALFIGFSFFQGTNTIQGLQNQMFGVFVFLFIFVMMMAHVLPIFVQQRTMFEARERQSRTYAWQTFIISNILVELCWNTVRTLFSTLQANADSLVIGHGDFLLLRVVLPHWVV